MKPSSSPPRVRRSARPIAAPSTTRRRQTLGGHAIEAALGRAGVAGAEVDDVIMGAALQQGSTGYNVARQSRVARGLADQRRRHVGRPAMRLRADGDFDRRQADPRRRHAHHDRRRPRIHLAGPERSHEPLSRHRSLAGRPSRRRLYVDARDRRNRRRALFGVARPPGRIRAAVAAAHRGGAGRRPVRQGNRAAAERDEGAGQGDRRRPRQGSDAEAGRGRPRRHDARRPVGPEDGVRRRPAQDDARRTTSPPATLRSSPTARAPAC